MGVNDLHGTVLSEPFHTRASEGKIVPYDRGGVTVIAANIRILKQEFGDRFLILEAGDEFTGSVESDLQQGAPLIQFWNSVGLTATAIGNHEFDYGLDVLKKRTSEANYPFLSANLQGLPWIKPSMMTSVGGIKIGVIGLTTTDTPNVSNKQATQGLIFSDLAKTTAKEARKLRQQGAQIVIVTVHAGEDCKNSDELGVKTETFHPRDTQSACEDKDEIPKFLKILPPGTVDAVVSGHTHTIVHQWISGVPVIEGGSHGFFYNLIYLTYDLDHHRVLKDQTRIEGPIPICSKIFSNQGDCNGNEPLPKEGRGDLVVPTLHGKLLQIDPADEANVSKWVGEDIKKYQSIVGYAARPIKRNYDGESEAANLVADILRERLQADVSLVNPGGLRADLEEGPITYSDLFRILPFQNHAIRIKLSGKELKDLVSAADTGRYGIFGISGLLVTLQEKFGSEPRKLEKVTFADGSPIQDDHDYQIATIDFLARGGDGLASTLGKISADRWQNKGQDKGQNSKDWGILRDLVARSLSEKSPVNSAEKPLLDSSHPRIVFTDPSSHQNR